jgi:hypothetical protein
MASCLLQRSAQDEVGLLDTAHVLLARLVLLLLEKRFGLHLCFLLEVTSRFLSVVIASTRDPCHVLEMAYGIDYQLRRGLCPISSAGNFYLARKLRVACCVRDCRPNLDDLRSAA